MASIGIFYFSGTGNTELVAKIMKERFLELGCSVDLVRMEDTLKLGLHVDPDQYDLIGIGCQVIGFDVPKLARDFIRNLPKSEERKNVFIFRTAGGVAPVNYNASKGIIRTLTKKGYSVGYERVFSISSNWVVKFENPVVKRLYDATEQKAERMCEEVLQGKIRILETGKLQKVIMRMAGFLSAGILRFMARDLIVDKTCTHCGNCIKICPAENIKEKRGKIRFGFSCSACMRCVYSCPGNSIRFRLLKFFPVKGGYQLNEVLGSKCDFSQLHNCSIPPFFYEYVNNPEL